MTDDEPRPPDSLPKYIADGVPKQDDDTLADLQEYVEMVLDHRSRAVDESDLPDEAEPIEVDGDDGPDRVDPALVAEYRRQHPDRTSGHFALERVKCGSDCTCNDGRGHGPYVYCYYYEDGRLQSDYVGKP